MAATTKYLEQVAHAENLLKVNPRLSEGEISEATGMSITSARRLLKRHERNASESTNESDSDFSLPVDFQESPSPVGEDIEESEPITKRGIKMLRGMLGMKDESDKPTLSPSSQSVKLTKRQQEFVTNFSPVFSYGFSLLTIQFWKRVGPEYEALKADDKTAAKIVEPLVRVYARHSVFVASMTPDQIDVSQALFALLAYVYTSYQMYREIKAKQLESEVSQYGYTTEENRPYQNGYREYRPGEFVSEQTRNNHSNNGRSVVATPSAISHADSESNEFETLDRADFTRPTTQQEALSRLAQLDFESRARRSGRLQ